MLRAARLSFVATLISLAGCVEFIERPKPNIPPPVPELSSGIIDLLNLQEKKSVSGFEYSSDSFSNLDIGSFNTPLGNRIYLRLSNLSVPLTEAIRHSRRQQDASSRLIELAQWGENRVIRAQALITLASYSNPDDIGIFRNVLTEQDPALRCAAIEALQIWNQPGTREMLLPITRETASPLVQIFAVQALLSLGDQSVLPQLYQGLESGSWIIRALSARYIGDYGQASDYEKVRRMVDKETLNDFVLAEAALSALKLFSRQQGAFVSYSPLSKNWRDNDEVKYWIRADQSVDIEPLVMLPPRLFIHDANTIAPVINQKLLLLMTDRLDLPLSKTDQDDANLENLYQLATPAGLALKTRYTKLSYLVAEGLAGTDDLYLRNELEKLALSNKNSLTRAIALISLSYGAKDLPSSLQQGLSDPDPLVRFGSIEALMTGRLKQGIPNLVGMALNDPQPMIRVVATNALYMMGNGSAPNFILNALSSSDWPTRAIGYWVLGRYGEDRDFSTALNAYTSEANPFVRAEIILASYRLQSLE